MKKIISPLLLAVLLTACATNNAKPALTANGNAATAANVGSNAAANAGSNAAANAGSNAAANAGAAHAPATPDIGPLPNVELTPDILYKLLLAEIAAQRGNADVAVLAYLDLAHETRDPRIARRATEIAWNARMPGAAQDAAELWVEVSNGALPARQVLATLLLSQGKLNAAQPQVEKLLAADKNNAGSAFMNLGAMLVQYPNRGQALQWLQTLAQPYGDVPEAHYVVGRAALNAGNDKLALDEARAALRLKSDWEDAALLQAQVLENASQADARDYLKKFLDKNPQASEVRLQYARLLANMGDYPNARDQFQRLLQTVPDDADIALTTALLSLQIKDYAAARTQFQQTLTDGYRDPDAVYFYLGTIDEDQGNNAAALDNYARVQDGQQYMAARARSAGILAKEGKLDEARAYLKSYADQTQDKQQRVLYAQMDAQLLNDAGQYQAAYDVYARALQDMPDSPDLLYDQAMIAEKLNNLTVTESNLRKVIQLRPDYAHAYNALGYTFADRNMRLPEAQLLIAQALKLAPDDPYIIDSMGWVLYRLGRNKDSLTYLQRAFDMSHDPEIAAHLGEVLWVDHQQAAAKRVWNSAFKEHADNAALNATMSKYLR